MNFCYVQRFFGSKLIKITLFFHNDFFNTLFPDSTAYPNLCLTGIALYTKIHPVRMMVKVLPPQDGASSVPTSRHSISEAFHLPFFQREAIMGIDCGFRQLPE
jgi:hypothetical protein